MQENRKILLLGAGGHCRSVLDSLISLTCYDEIRLVDKCSAKSTEEDEEFNPQDILFDCPIIGEDEDLSRLFEEGYTDAFITVGSVGNVTTRQRLHRLLKQIGFHLPNIIDHSSVVSPYASLGEGIFVGKKAVINANALIGDCAIINTAAIIEHECSIGEYAHIAPGAILGGNVIVGSKTHIGSGSVIRQGIHIGSDSMIGMGSVVVKNMGSGVTAYGNPCKVVNN